MTFDWVRRRRVSKARRAGERQARRSTSPGYWFLHLYRFDLNLFIKKGFIVFARSCEQEGVCLLRDAAGDCGDDVRAAEPVCFGEIGLRPLCRMVRMRVVEADDVEPALASL